MSALHETPQSNPNSVLLENTGANSNNASNYSYKFWEGWVDGTKLVVRYGRIGTEGQTRTKECNSKWRAEDALTKKVYEKKAKGYR